MKKNLTLVVLLSIMATAAPKASSNGPTFNLDCTRNINGNCEASSTFFLSGDGYSAHKTYRIYGSSPEHGINYYESVLLTADAGGSIQVEASVPAGDWTFTIYNVNHNATPQKDFGTADATFE